MVRDLGKVIDDDLTRLPYEELNAEELNDVDPEPEPEPEPELKATLRELESKLQGLQSTPGAVAATAPARRAEEEAQRNLMSRKRSAAAKAKAQQRKAEPEPEPEPGKFSGAYWWLAVAGVLIAVAVSALAAAFSAELMALAADGMQATQSLTGVTDGRLNDMRATMRAAERSRLSSPEQELLEMAEAREAERAQRIAATLDARRAKLGVDDEAQRSEAEREKHRDKQKAAYEASLIRRKANPAAAAAATATAAATAAGGGVAQQQQQEEGDPPAPVVQKAEPERGAQIATTNGCVCMPVTYDRSDPSDPREWHGCGAAGWCDVQPGCANAQQPRMPLYHGRDDCRLLQQ
jgi:DNA repair exonuclease SbcCD ATPase subunit